MMGFENVTNHHLSLDSVKWFRSKDKCILYHKYSRYLHQITTVVFTIVPAMERTKHHVSSTIIVEEGSFAYLIYSPTGLHLVVQACGRINNMLELDNSANKFTSEMNFRLSDGGEDGKFNVIGFVQ